MAKKPKPNLDIPGQPLPEHFHPKDTPAGVVLRSNLSHGCQSDCHRKTVLIWIGGSALEMTPSAAQILCDQLARAIRCAEGKSEKP